MRLDHLEVRVFEDVTWSDIIGKPQKYLNAQWYDSNNDWSTPWKTGSEYTVIEGSPY